MSLPHAPAAEQSPDLEKIKARLKEVYISLPSAAAPSVTQGAKELISPVGADNRWPDIDYRDSNDTKKPGLPAMGHLIRLKKLAYLYATLPASDPSRAEIAKTIPRLVDGWLAKPPHTHHHWFLEIGAPIELAQIALFAGDLLSPEQIDGMVQLMRASVGADGRLYYGKSVATGQNLLWEAWLQVVAGCLANNPEWITKYSAMAVKEMLPTTAEGIQADASFHQHGPLLYFGGYGLDFGVDSANLVYVLEGTPYALPPAVVESITRYLLDGVQWSTRGGNWDFGVIGRCLAREDHDPVPLAVAADRLAIGGNPRAEELKAFARRLRGEDAPGTAPSGHEVFWRSEYVPWQRPDFFFAARMSSLRVRGHESGNGEAEDAYHLGDGATCVMITGEEYRNIFPLWDWRRVPGTTAPLGAKVPRLRPQNFGRGAEGGSDYANGVTDGRNGAAAMQLAHGDISARKAWFFLDDAVVCLGAGIETKNPATPVATSVEQCWARGPVQTSGGPLPAAGKKPLKGPGWVQHAGVTYIFPEGSAVQIARENKTGNWTTVNRFLSKPKEIKGEIFSIWLEHNLSKGPGSYAYIVAPGLSPEKLSKTEVQLPRILANTTSSQAVASADGALVQAVFWEAGELKLPDGQTLSVDQPSLVQWRRSGEVSVGNLAQKGMDVLVRLSGGSRAAELAFTFPADPATAGKPQTKTIPEAAR